MADRWAAYAASVDHQTGVLAYGAVATSAAGDLVIVRVGAVAPAAGVITSVDLGPELATAVIVSTGMVLPSGALVLRPAPASAALAPEDWLYRMTGILAPSQWVNRTFGVTTQDPESTAVVAASFALRLSLRRHVTRIN